MNTNIDKYVKQLLDFEDCVIVPNFGGFISNYKNSTIQEAGIVSILPPQKQILFNVNLAIDDGLLIKYISNNEQITYNDAKKNVDDFVKEILQNLKENGRIVLENLGSFSINKSKKIQFEPLEEFIPQLDSFGLPTLKLYTINRKQGSSEINIIAPKFHVSKKNVKRVILLSPFMLAIALLPTNFYNNIQESSFLSILDSSVKQHTNIEINNATELNNSDDEVKLKVIETLKQETSKESGLMYIEPPMAKNFHVVLGSFKEFKNAESFVQELKSKNIDSEIILKGGFYRVSSMSFVDKDLALKHLQEMRLSDSYFKEAWVYNAI